MFKRKRNGEPLIESVKETVRKMCKWRDACDGLFTVESEIEVGENFVGLDVKGVDEVDMRSFAKLIASIGADGVGHVADYCINFEKQTLTFQFESLSRKVRSAIVPSVQDESAAFKEYESMKSSAPDECHEDILTASKCMAAIKSCVSTLQLQMMQCDMKILPGLIVISARGMRKMDKKMNDKMFEIQAKHEVGIVVNVSPKNNQCLQISVKKRKETVNL